MPFGHDCEYETFDDCVADQQDRGHDAESARRICGALQRDTEDKCNNASMKRYRNVIKAVHETPWAILPSKLREITNLLELKDQGIRLTREQIRERVGDIAQPQLLQDVEVPAADGEVEETETARIAVLNLFGTITQRANIMQEFSGGTSTEQFARAFEQAMSDDRVIGIVLNVDSPGGAVPGVPELSRRIFEARGEKPIVAVANGVMASAAYYVASAADEVVATPSATDIGSIGVFAVHTDQSEADKQDGVKRTVFRSAPNKQEDSPFEPLTDEAREFIEQKIGQIHDNFVAAVARNRNVPVSRVESDFGQGRSYLADEALQRGLVDRIATLEEVFADMGVGEGSSTNPRATASARSRVPSFSAKEHSKMDPKLKQALITAGLIQAQAGDEAAEAALNAYLHARGVSRPASDEETIRLVQQSPIVTISGDGVPVATIRQRVNASSLSDETKQIILRDLAAEADTISEADVDRRINEEAAKAAAAGVDPSEIVAMINMTGSLTDGKKLELSNELVAQAKTLTHKQVLDRLNQEAVAATPGAGASRDRVESTASEVDKFHTSARDAILSRTFGPGDRPQQIYNFRTGDYEDWQPAGRGRNYGLQSLPKLATKCLLMAGYSQQQVDNLAPQQIARLVLGADPASLGLGYLAASDGPHYNVSGMFSNILLDAQNVLLRRSYDDTRLITYQMWMRQGESVPDFKTVNKVIAGELGDPKAVPEDGEFEETTLSDSKETYKLTVWGEVFSRSWQLMVNDQLNSFTEIPTKMGRAIRRKQNRLAYQHLKDNPTMSEDSNSLFDNVNHSNQTTGALSTGSDYVSAWNTMTQKMGEQTGLDSDSGVLNLMPQWVVFPPALRGIIRETLGSPSVAINTEGNSNTTNIWQAGLQPVMEGELGSTTSGGSDTAFYLAADNSDVDTVEYAFLQGLETPVIEQEPSFDRLGMRWRIYQAFAVQALDYRGLQKHTGA